MRQIRNLKIVCFGGGTGLPALLSGLKHNPLLDITAVVTMFDSGGSSGELKDRHGILPPSDLLRCIYALTKYDEKMVREIMLSRLPDNHTAGNIMALGMAKLYDDNQKPIDALSQVFAVQGKVVPVSFDKSNLCATFMDSSIVYKEADIDAGIKNGKDVMGLFLDSHAKANPRAIDAIKNADILCVGPGSFYTSVLPNFLPQGIKEAIRDSTAAIIFIANLMTEGSGMDDYSVSKMAEILTRYMGQSPRKIVVNSHVPKLAQEQKEMYKFEGKRALRYDNSRDDLRLAAAELWTDILYARHDSTLLAAVVSSLCHELHHCWRA